MKLDESYSCFLGLADSGSCKHSKNIEQIIKVCLKRSQNHMAMVDANHVDWRRRAASAERRNVPHRY